MPPRAPPERNDVRAVAIVPARLGSRRLARKMLLAETGLPLFAHTARNLERCGALERVVVATDSEEIAARARELSIEAVLTRADHASGTDRVHEALQALELACDVVVDVQGDEPELDPLDLERLIAAFADETVEAATLCGRFASAEEAAAPQAVKVVRDARGDALYFSRSCVPHRAGAGGAYAREGARPWLEVVRRHVGVYAFRPDALARFVALPAGELEASENLEQLRWLEAGRRMRVVEAGHVALGIDTREDYDAFVARVATRGDGRSQDRWSSTSS
jgi:3-deoxy-manno-octulosonate cytidylyltransferase (CMP-KDO synthetase)